jgi:hypothetical protein
MLNKALPASVTALYRKDGASVRQVARVKKVVRSSVGIDLAGLCDQPRAERSNLRVSGIDGGIASRIQTFTWIGRHNEIRRPSIIIGGRRMRRNQGQKPIPQQLRENGIKILRAYHAGYCGTIPFAVGHDQNLPCS